MLDYFIFEKINDLAGRWQLLDIFAIFFASSLILIFSEVPILYICKCLPFFIIRSNELIKTFAFVTDTINKSFEILKFYGTSTKLSEQIMCKNLIYDLKESKRSPNLTPLGKNLPIESWSNSLRSHAYNFSLYGITNLSQIALPRLAITYSLKLSLLEFPA